MNVEFNDKALEELFLYGVTNDKRYNRLPKAIIKRYVKVVNYLRAARRIEDKEAVWINDQYRLIFQSSTDSTGIIVDALLLEISKHYE